MKSAENGETRIFGIRHGEVIKPQSNPLVFLHQQTPDTAVLSPEGRANVRRTVKTAKEREKFRNGTVIFSSERKRALNTAAIAKVILGSEKIIVDPLLNNRNVHETIDNMHLAHANGKKILQRVIPETDWELEARTAKFIDSLRRKHAGRDILIVSHTENLSLAQAQLLGLPREDHQDLKFEYAELRKLDEEPRRRLKF